MSTERPVRSSASMTKSCSQREKARCTCERCSDPANRAHVRRMWRADWGGCHPERERGVWAGSAARRPPAGSLAPARDDSIVMNERERALHLYRRIERESLFASLVLIGEPAAVRTIGLRLLRWRSRLDFAIDHYAKSKIEPEIRDVLRVGAYQLMFMDVAKYAAVAETVSLAPKRARGFANAILRRISAHAPGASPVAHRSMDSSLRRSESGSHRERESAALLSRRSLTHRRGTSARRTVDARRRNLQTARFHRRP